MGAMHAEDGRLAHRVVVGHGLLERNALHVGRALDIEELQQRGGQVDHLHQPIDALRPPTDARIPDEERRVRHFVVEGLHHLGPPVMLAQQEAMIGADDEHGVVPQVQLVHQIEDLAQIFVAHAQQRCVFEADMLDLFLGLIDGRDRAASRNGRRCIRGGRGP